LTLLWLSKHLNFGSCILGQPYVLIVLHAVSSFYTTFSFRFGLSITGAYGLLSTGKTMFADVVTPAFPALAAVASTFVITMSLSNLGGRFFYSTLSDYFVKWTGKDPFYGLFFFKAASFKFNVFLL